MKESLRLIPPGWMTTREALADVVLPSGLFIPQGTVCYIDIRGIQRDPDYWQQPDDFQPDRFMDKVCVWCWCGAAATFAEDCSREQAQGLGIGCFLLLPC